MKRNILLVLCLFLFFSFFAQNLPVRGDSDFEQSDEATHYPAMILVQDTDIDEAIADLENKGIIVLRHRKNILLTYVPVILMDSPQDEPSSRKLKKFPGVKKIEISKPRQNTPLMKKARFFNEAYLINEGLSLPQPYDGKGIVVGVCDIGMDTRHPNFLNKEQTECRIKKVVHYQEQQGLRTEYSTPQEIYDWRTDTDDDWHATHVTGIAAGGHRESGYYSLAPEADIVFTASQLSDVGLLAGVEDIIEYAKEVKKPAVINLSMGNYIGPHDGSSLFTQYLDLCAEDAIICLSAGNEGSGGDPKSLSYDFTDSKTEVRTVVCDYAGVDVAGQAEIWSLDSSPFEFTFYWNSQTNFSSRLEVYEPIDFDSLEGKYWRISADPEDPDYDETLGAHFNEGYVKVEGGVSPLNGHYFVSVEFELQTDERHLNLNGEKEKYGEYWPGLKIQGNSGTHIDVFCGGTNVRLHQANGGFPFPDNTLCFSDLATGFKTISVGMMNNTDVEDNAAEGSGLREGEVTLYSSYGTLPDGRVMPLTVAPGAYVISSISSAFMEKYPDYLNYIDDTSRYNDETVYWIGTLGTSMSCPFVAGTIATWLQAYPQLTAEEAISIIQKTNQKSGYPNPSDPRHGQGWFNPYRGLQEVVSLAALKVGTVDAPELNVRYNNGMLHFGNPSGELICIDIFSPSGVRISKATFNDTIGSYNLDFLPSGIYLIKVSSASGKTRAIKIVI